MFLIILLLGAAVAQGAVIRGQVHDENRAPLYLANVMVEELQIGASTNENGEFFIDQVTEGRHTLRISQVGYETAQRTVTLAATDTMVLAIGLDESPVTVDDVDVTTDRVPSGVAMDTPVRMEIVSSEDLQQSATGGDLISGLSGQTGLKTAACAMCGSRGIGLQGLDPSYTEVTVDNMPVLSGLGTLYGLEGISASDVSRVELVKGAGDTESGSGAIAGSVNLVSARPTQNLSGTISVTGSQYGQFNTAGALSGPVWGVPMRLSVSHGAETERIDRDDDNVTDTPKYYRTNVSYGTAIGWGGGTLDIGSRIFHEHRFAGELNWSTRDRGSAEVYGREITTTRQELSLKYNRSLAEGWNGTAETALVNHKQDSWYGMTSFDAQQKMAVSRLSLERSWNPRQQTLLQLSHNYQDYTDNLKLNSQTDLRYSVPGMVVQHNWSPSTQWEFQVGDRIEYYSDHGTINTPRVAAGWRPDANSVIRLSAGAGFRPVTIFSLDAAAHAGFEHVVLSDQLEPERTLGTTLAFNRRWISRMMNLSLDLSVFYTKFDNMVTIEHGMQTAHIIYNNADQGFSRGAELQARWNHRSGWGLQLGATRTQVRYSNPMGWHNAQFQYSFTGDATLSKTWSRSGIGADIGTNVYGPQYISDGHGREKSPVYATWTSSIRKSWRMFTASFTVENMFDWTQSDNPYPRDPATGFLLPDSALLYGPLLGRTFHIGLTYRIG